MGRLLAAGVLGVVVALVSVAARGHASAGPVVAGASRVVDSTFLCSIELSSGGYPDPVVQRRTILLSAGSTTDGKERRSSAHVGDKYAASILLNLFVGPSRDRYGTLIPGVLANPKPCTLLRSTPIPLSSTKLRRLGNPNWERKACNASQRVLIRMRAVLGRFALWFKSQENDFQIPMLTLKSTILDASIAVSTAPAHKPIAFVRLTRTGPPKVYLAAHCTAD